MKATIIKCISILLCSLIALGSISCTMLPTDSTNQGMTVNLANAASKYSVIPAENTEAGELSTSFKDGTHWYYLFYLGQIIDVPLEEGKYEYHDGVPREKEFKTSTITTNSISKAVNRATENCTSWKEEFSNTVGIESEIKAEIEGIGASVKSSLEVGYSHEISKTTSETWEESYESGSDWSEEHSETTTFSFTEDTPIGYYRYITVGVIDVYALVIYNPSEDLYVIDNIEELVVTGHKLDYSQNDPTFKDIEYGSLEFDTSLLENLVEPTKSYTDILPDNETEIHIKKPQDLLQLKGNTAGKTFYLDNDIDLKTSNLKWETIESFEGVFDGQGNTISGMEFTFYDGADVDWGMFKTIQSSATVKNVNFSSCKATYIAPEEGYAISEVKFGFVSAFNYGTISNCTFVDNLIDIDANTKVASQFAYVGVVTCENYGTINNCTVERNTVSIDSDSVSSDSADDKSTVAVAAGICAYNQREGYVSNCQSTGNSIYTRVCYLADEGEDVKAVSAGMIGFQYGKENNTEPTDNELTAIKRYYKAHWGLFGNFKGTEYEDEESGDCGQLYARN